MKPEELNISGETFKELREQMNLAINNGIRGMRDKGVDECTVSSKIRIEIGGKVSLTLPVKGEVKLPTKTGMKCIGSGAGYMVMDDQISIDEILREDDDDDL